MKVCMLPVIQFYLNEIMAAKDGSFEASKEDLINKLAHFHWWFTHASPLNRGSSFAAEVIAAAVAKVFGVDLEFTEMPDLCALTMPLEAFVPKYLEIANCHQICPAGEAKSEAKGPDAVLFKAMARNVETACAAPSRP